MELTVVGCSGSFPGPDGPASCYLVTAEGFRLVIDLGNGALGHLQRYVRLDQIDAICLSHLHSDHCLDMCSLYVARTFHPGGPLPPVPVYGPAGAAERLGRAAGAESAQTVADRFEFRPLTPGTLQIGPFAITADHMNHPVETFGFRLEHGGRVIAYSADTGPCEPLVALASGADVLICEATFTDRPGLPAGLHLTASQAARHAARAQAGQLVLTHLMPWSDRERALAEGRPGFPGPIRLATAGLLL